ncbi:SLBB domain-containing protein [SAR86 cluster bacterium]|nr:SLBB domain-containing protein [SAR86 cluster bacterium]
MINLKNTFKFIFVMFLIFLSSLVSNQNIEDLEYLNLLPESQAQSIAERLGVQTGKPVIDEVKMETIDEPSFSSLRPKNLEDSNISYEENTNQNQEVFGLNLFKDSPTTFAPIDLAPAPLDYVIGPGDELRIQLFGNQSINRLVPVNREGNLLIPEIGVVQVSGLTFEEAKKKINSIVVASLIGVTVEISLAKIRSIQVFVLGNAFSPGAYTVSSLSNISNVLFFSGGPTKNGSLRNIEVKRSGKSIAKFDFYDLLINGNINSDIRLLSNDVLVINPTGKTVSINGAVKKEARFELKEGETFSDLLNFSSGFLNLADKEKITISSIANNGERVFKNYSFQQIKSASLNDGDEIFVHQLSNTPRNIIKIIGEIASPGSIAFEEGLSLVDLISPESFLESTYTPFAIIERENIFGSKRLIRANLLSNNGSSVNLSPNDTIYILSKKDVTFLNSILVADALSLLSEKNSSLISDFFRKRGLDRYQCKSLQILAKQSSSSSIRFVKSKYLPNPNLNPVDQLEFVESCPSIFENKPYLIIFTLENSSVISGEVRNPGIYPAFNISSPNDLLSFAGGATEKSSGMLDVYTDEGISLKVNIDEEENLSSLGVDSSFYANMSSNILNEVFSVSLEGAFNSPGIYGAKQGERLSDLISRAGGYKLNAYPYGGILARKSVAEKEKLAFMRSADQLEQSIATAISSGRISSVGGDPTLALSSISRLISNLQNIEPIGRVVTEFDLDQLISSPEQDLLLEPGDRIFVPERSSTITVSGQVLSPTSFNFNPAYKVKNYINLAGGYSEEADRNRTLVIYPNGMASRVKNWPNSPDLSPGTTLVVPRDPNPFDWLVFSQVLFPIISNFATSAAAIAALGNNN